MKPRARPQDPVSEYQATRSSPDVEAPAGPREVPYYPVTLVRDETDGAEWVATVDVLPGCNARGSTPDEALERVAAAVAEWVAAAGREGKEIPDPKSAQSHSGRLLLRMPQTLHAELARAAERERVSLNQFITDALSGSLGWRAPNRETARATRVVPEEQLEGEPGTSRWQDRPRVTNAVFIANVVVVGLAAIVAIVVLIATVRSHRAGADERGDWSRERKGFDAADVGNGLCPADACGDGLRRAQAGRSAAFTPQRRAPGSVARRLVRRQVSVEREHRVDVRLRSSSSRCATSGQSDPRLPRGPRTRRAGHAAATCSARPGQVDGTGSSRPARRMAGRGRPERAALGCELEPFRLAARGRLRTPAARDRGDDFPGLCKLTSRRRPGEAASEAARYGRVLSYSPGSAATLSRRAGRPARRSSSRR